MNKDDLLAMQEQYLKEYKRYYNPCHPLNQKARTLNVALTGIAVKLEALRLEEIAEQQRLKQEKRRQQIREAVRRFREKKQRNNDKSE